MENTWSDQEVDEFLKWALRHVYYDPKGPYYVYNGSGYCIDGKELMRAYFTKYFPEKLKPQISKTPKFKFMPVLRIVKTTTDAFVPVWRIFLDYQQLDSEFSEEIAQNTFLKIKDRLTGQNIRRSEVIREEEI